MTSDRATDFDGLNTPAFGTRDEACGQISILCIDEEIMLRVLICTPISQHNHPFGADFDVLDATSCGTRDEAFDQIS